MHLITSEMSVLKLMSISQDEQDVNIRKNDPIEVISLDGDDDEANDIEKEDVEDLSNNSDNKNNSENDPDVMEVISLVDEESSSDENEDIPIGTAKLSFLDAENKKIHRFIKIRNAEDEKVLVDVVGVSSDSDVEEVIEEDNDKSIYITIDPDDYKKVLKEKVDSEYNKKKKRRSNANVEDYSKTKINKSNDPAISSYFEGVEGLDSSVDDSQHYESHESPDSLKGPNIPKAICCQNCTFYCFKEDELLVHIAVKHPSKAESVRTYTAAEIQELEREMRDQAGDCSSCGQALWYLPTLRAHALIHSTGKFGCEACHHGTSVIKLLMEHLESHVGSEEEEDSDL